MSALSVYRFDTSDTSLLFSWREGIPELSYIGESLPSSLDASTYVLSRTKPLPKGVLDESATLSLHPEPGRGFMGHPALLAHRVGSESRAWAGQFLFASHTEHLDGVTFLCRDEARGLSLSLDIRIDSSTSVLTLTSTLENEGDDLVLDWLSAPVLPLPKRFSEFMRFTGRWCGEFDIARRPIGMGLEVMENRRGRTSHETFPGLIMYAPTTNEDSGLCLGAHLGWSGNHRIVVERLSHGDGQLQMGFLGLPGEIVLGCGERFETPPVYVSVSSCGFNGVSRKFHNHVRDVILEFGSPKKSNRLSRHPKKLEFGSPKKSNELSRHPKKHPKNRPVTFNTWEAVYFDHNIETLRRLADRASSIGVERYVLDDGWFGRRNNDDSSLGDWYEDTSKYPEGLGELVDYVCGLGLEFGLWVEPEMVSPDSDLYRSHPDWALGYNPYSPVTGRNQLVLDLTNPSVTDYLYERLSSLLSKYEISYLKWDMNRDHVLPGDSYGSASSYRQTLSLYSLIDRLRLDFPDVEIESCASGGARIDYGILSRTHRFWVSDSNDSVERMRIQRGFSYFFPPEIMGSHVGPSWCHTSGRGLDVDFRGLVASYGHMGLELDLLSIDDSELESLRLHIESHKRDRSLWHSGDFYRLRTVDDNLFGVSVVSPSKKSGRVIVAQLDRSRFTIPPSVCIPGLSPELNYRVTPTLVGDSVMRGNRSFDNPLMSGDLVLPGSVIIGSGIQLPVLYAQTGLGLSLESV